MKYNNFYFNNGISKRQLAVQSKKIADYAKRDLEQLQAKGITAELIAELEAKAKSLEDSLDYGTNVTERKILTTLRNEKMEEVKGSIEMFRSQLRLIFLEPSSKYHAVFTRSMSKLNVDEFINLATESLHTLELLTSEIAIYGITAEEIASFRSQVTELVDGNQSQVNVAGSLVNSTYESSELKREIYQLLERISIIGKTYWKRKNIAMSKNYIIRKKTSVSEGDDVDDGF